MTESVRSLSLTGTALASVGALSFAMPAINVNEAPARALNLTEGAPAISLVEATTTTATAAAMTMTTTTTAGVASAESDLSALTSRPATRTSSSR
ncbi:hypothetical protein [Mycolicibacterium sp.]|uniref:hypothetical protein n=1 Tax=Mycolicibacterium sp. TaxID=2320850 RepID=UPI001DA629E7|nr:hypothetical protein [Mycolicibacterium sp.]MCB1126556.1 hypothetical protein [Verrucomicrobiae bacterium]MCB1291164.1 hypothetical protein [Mycobacterium sp.]MCB9410393.1 hypothetical protein [Mycolicibacterium sp.]